MCTLNPANESLHEQRLTTRRISNFLTSVANYYRGVTICIIQSVIPMPRQIARPTVGKRGVRCDSISIVYRPKYMRGLMNQCSFLMPSRLCIIAWKNIDLGGATTSVSNCITWHPPKLDSQQQTGCDSYSLRHHLPTRSLRCQA